MTLSLAELTTMITIGSTYKALMIILNFFLKVVSLLRLKNLVGQRIKNTSRFRGGSAICDSQYKYIVQKFCQKKKGGWGV